MMSTLKKSRLFIFTIGLSVLLCLPGNARGRSKAEERKVASRGPLTAEEQTTIQIFEEASKGVAYITTKQRRYSMFNLNAMEVPSGSGSGFIWDRKGHIVTNYHVLQGGSSFEVVLHDQSSYEARVIGSYPEKDLAVLKINAPAGKLNPIPLGEAKGLKVGQKVLAIGNPFGLDHTLTTGVVSALNRTLEAFRGRKIEGAIQTDAAINPGNSGGPLLDSAGRLIGVNTQIYSTSGSSAGIGFAIPIDTVNTVVSQLIKFGKVIRPGLGIWMHAQNSRLTRYLGVKGVVVRDVQPNSGAEVAGLRGIRWRRDGTPIIGDIILEIDGKEIHSSDDLVAVLDTYRVGDRVKLTCLRGGERKTLIVELSAIE